MIELYQGDCFRVMEHVESKSIDLIISDWPYNIKKADWDRWKTKQGYIDWIETVLIEYQRILKDNGSFYFFHNDFLQVVEIQNLINRRFDFVFQQFIVWDKFNGSEWSQLNAIVHSDLNRNYSKQAEYILFYVNSAGCKTTWDKTGLTMVKHDVDNFQTLRKYFKELQTEWIGHSIKRINEDFRNRKAEHCFYWKSTQWDLPTEPVYNQLIEYYCINHWLHFREYELLRQEYELLRQEYESLRQEYESRRYTFNNQGIPSVWQFPPEKPNGHVTPKPIGLIENIIKHSSNEGDTVADFFFGSGTTPAACKNLNRDFIGSENNQRHFEIAKDRLKK